MDIKENTKKFLGGVVLGLSLAACGGGELQYIQDFKYGLENNDLDLEVIFNSDLSLNTELAVPIKNYGTVYLSPSDGDAGGFSIKAELNLDSFGDESLLTLSKTNRLPNEQRMSTYVKNELVRLELQASKDVGISAYLGLESNFNYIGVAVELNFIGGDFPSGLVLTQRLRDQQGRMLGVISIYGPEVINGQVKHPGGIFFVSNASDLVQYIKNAPQNVAAAGRKIGNSEILMPENKTDINQVKFDSKKEQFKLYQLFKKKGLQAGLLDP